MRAAGPVLLALAAAVGCGLDHQSDAMDWTLSGGASVGELARGGPVVLVVVDPGWWFRCHSVLAEWLEWECTSGVNVRLLLSREPAEAERRILLAAGIRTDGHLAGVRVESHRTPIELVADTGGIIHRAERACGPSGPLLEALKDGRSVREAVRALGQDKPGARERTAEEPGEMSEEGFLARQAEPQPQYKKSMK